MPRVPRHCVLLERTRAGHVVHGVALSDARVGRPKPSPESRAASEGSSERRTHRRQKQQEKPQHCDVGPLVTVREPPTKRSRRADSNR